MTTLGSIPAHAGEPRDIGIRSTARGVYPRACGGTPFIHALVYLGPGLSPRMRGNHGRPVDDLALLGSIPAHAGEPTRDVWDGSRFRVYPRACGGTRWATWGCPSELGLSPRMRGNPGHSACGWEVVGSIPAHAGEPSAATALRPCSRVYPRACGGTTSGCRLADQERGLSPRMRGNLRHPSSVDTSTGSIPAHAGEPGYGPHCPSPRRVYPRACGGTLTTLHLMPREAGLSPRMRGNLHEGLALRRNPGSIPAHAGEPISSLLALSRSRVYPRACGGTDQLTRRIGNLQGLSPRMRGNRTEITHTIGEVGSIPAHAGEPAGSKRSRLRARVYPRACGGTGLGIARAHREPGLSPRMRGNRLPGAQPFDCKGSIPAHAGEPGSLYRRGCL